MCEQPLYTPRGRGISRSAALPWLKSTSNTDNQLIPPPKCQLEGISESEGFAGNAFVQLDRLSRELKLERELRKDAIDDARRHHKEREKLTAQVKEAEQQLQQKKIMDLSDNLKETASHCSIAQEPDAEPDSSGGEDTGNALLCSFLDPGEQCEAADRMDGCEKRVWHKDSTNCEVCQKGFGLLRRRHHCRQCGACVCSSCSPFRTYVSQPWERPSAGYAAQLGSDKVAHRVCTGCYSSNQGVTFKC